MFLKILLITIVLLAIAFAGFAVKMFFKKNGRFEKQCGSIDPTTGKRLSCTCGAAGGGEKCDNKP
jgi:hypothetical protein